MQTSSSATMIRKGFMCQAIGVWPKPTQAIDERYDGTSRMEVGLPAAHRQWITDERTGKRRLTSYAMTRADAAERFQDAEPDLGTREIRDFPEPGERRGNTRPPSSNERSPGPFSSGGRYSTSISA